MALNRKDTKHILDAVLINELGVEKTQEEIEDLSEKILTRLAEEQEPIIIYEEEEDLDEDDVDEDSSDFFSYEED